MTASTLSSQEIAALAASHDIIELGTMADTVRQRLHGNRTTFLRVATVPIDATADAWPSGIGEIRIAGVPTDRRTAVERVRAVSALAGGIPVSAFSLADLERVSAAEHVTLRLLLEELCAAGLDLVAEAAFDTLQDQRRSIEEVNIAGLALARLSVFQLPSADVVPFYSRIAEVQRRVGVIRSFAPLPRTVNPAIPTTGYDDVKRVALARLIVHNIASIQVDWSLYGPKLAQVALTVGADDLDGVAPGDDLSEGRRRAPLEEVRRNIRAAGQEPVERDGRFEILESSGGVEVALRGPGA